MGRWDVPFVVLAIAILPLDTSGWALVLQLSVLALFLLFCNVFRIPLWLELAWATLFLGALTQTGLSLEPRALLVWAWASGAVAIFVATRLPLYHGVFWEKLNPRLAERWALRRATERRR